jgi:GDP-D-mannose dehydratase
MQRRTALIAGSTGVVGQSLARRSIDGGSQVFGILRGKQADFQDATTVRDTLQGRNITDVLLSE